MLLVMKNFANKKAAFVKITMVICFHNSLVTKVIYLVTCIELKSRALNNVCRIGGCENALTCAYCSRLSIELSSFCLVYPSHFYCVLGKGTSRQILE